MSKEPCNSRFSKQPGLFETIDSHSEPKHTKRYAVMHCDGACSGNPGKSGIGVVIDLFNEDTQCDEDKETHTISEYIGIATNNIAEYTALIRGLEKARALGVKKIEILLDSELLVRQINGIYKVKNKNLLPLWIQAGNILKDFDAFKVTHVRRENNKEADFLATQAVKNKTDL